MGKKVTEKQTKKGVSGKLRTSKPKTKKTPSGRPNKQQSIEHRAKLLEMLIRLYSESKVSGRISTADVAKHIGTTEPTAAKIVKEVAATLLALKPSQSDGQIHWGGDSYYEQNRRKNLERKLAVGYRFAEIVDPITSVACSAGTTVTQCIRAANQRGKPLDVVTNNLGIVEEWADIDDGLVLTGGEYDYEAHALKGHSVTQIFANCDCSIGLIGVSGVSPKGRLFVNQRWEAEYRKAITTSVRGTIYIVADLSKLSVRDRWEFASISELADKHPNLEIVLITNRPTGLKDEDEEPEDTLGHLQELAKQLREINRTFRVELA